MLRRSGTVRCPGAWEAVHGHVEAGETPVAAAVRELGEETGFTAERLYNLSRMEAFYLHRTDQVALIPVFAAVIDPAALVVLSGEHDGWRWLPLAKAGQELAWPRERRSLEDVAILLGSGGAGPLEDVLRVF